MSVVSQNLTRPAPRHGVATLQFGAFPGSAATSVVLPGWADPANPQGEVKAWVMPYATVDHTADEHVVDPPRVSITALNGDLTISGFQSGRDLTVPPGTPYAKAASQQPIASQQALPYGAWSVAWAFASP